MLICQICIWLLDIHSTQLWTDGSEQLATKPTRNQAVQVPQMCTNFARNLILTKRCSLAVTNDSVEDTRGFVSKVGRQVVLWNWNTKHSSTSEHLVKQGKLSVPLNVRAYLHPHRTFALLVFYKPSLCQCNLISVVHANRLAWCHKVIMSDS